NRPTHSGMILSISAQPDELYERFGDLVSRSEFVEIDINSGRLDHSRGGVELLKTLACYPFPDQRPVAGGGKGDAVDLWSTRPYVTVRGLNDIRERYVQVALWSRERNVIV